MSKYETRDNSGSLFRNTDKKNERGPDYSGTAVIDGTEFYMDAWLKESENGRKWMSFSFKPKQQKEAPKPQTDRQRAAKFRQDDSEIPF